jgi:hypothetical protein
VDGPVGAARLTELPGAVQRIDDPDPARTEPRGVVGTLLGEHHVTRPPGGQRGGEELVRQPVAGLAQHVRVAALGAQFEQPPARLAGQVAGEHVIVAGHPGSSSW